MNPLVYASLTLLLTVIQAVGVDAKGKKKGSSSKPGKKLPIALIAGVVVAGVVLLIIAGILFLVWKRYQSRSKKTNVALQPQNVPYGGAGLGPDPEKHGQPFSPAYPSTPPAQYSQPQHGQPQYSQPGWGQDAPPQQQQFNTNPSYPTPYNQPHA